MYSRSMMKRRRTKSSAGARTYSRNGGAGVRTSQGRQSSQMRVGPTAIARSLSSPSLSTVFTVSTSQLNQTIRVQQETTQTTSFKSGVLTGPSIRISSQLGGISVYIGGGDTFYPFSGVAFLQDSFDFYTLDRVEILMYCGSTLMGSIPGVDNTTELASAAQPVYAYCVDSNDVDPTTLAQVLSFGNVNMKQIEVNSPIACSYKPAGVLDMGNTSPGQGPIFSPKINTLSSGVEHYGFKVAPMGLSAYPDPGTGLAPICIGLVTFVVKQYVTFYDRRTL